MDERELKVRLGTYEVEILTEIMCARACSMGDAVRWLIALHAEGRAWKNAYMRRYMRERRAAARRTSQ
jgi:hypothetical protein